MFTVFEKEGTLVLQSEGARAEILPACGAILNRWQVRMHHSTRELIEGYTDADDFAQHAETKGFRSCKLSPYVCRIPHGGRYSFDGEAYQVGKYNLAGSSIHGLLYNEPFQLTYSEAGEKHAMAVLQHTYGGTDAGYPFPYFIEVIYYLLPDNSLSIATTLFNKHHSPIPIADGWHPYFTLGKPVDELYLEIATDNMLVFDDALVPTGALKPEGRFEFPHSLEGMELDNCFLLRQPLVGPACSLVNTEDKIALQITPDANYPYLQVYTPPHRQSIAIENLSAAPDAFNNRMGLIVLEPDEQIKFTTTYQLIEWT
jgi:aldose 1-epimerase